MVSDPTLFHNRRNLFSRLINRNFLWPGYALTLGMKRRRTDIPVVERHRFRVVAFAHRQAVAIIEEVLVDANDLAIHRETEGTRFGRRRVPLDRLYDAGLLPGGLQCHVRRAKCFGLRNSLRAPGVAPFVNFTHRF